NAVTLAVYPFQFIFQVQYEIEEHTLYCSYIVKNINEGEMHFSVGGHPAFRVPLNGDLRYEDYILEFNKDTSLKRFLLDNGLINNKTEIVTLDDKKLYLESALFYDDAIVLKHINSDQIKLYSNKGPNGLVFRFEGFPYFGIWAAKDAPFVCLEPWCGIADNIHHDYQLTNKEGINQLAGGGIFKRTWSVELY